MEINKNFESQLKQKIIYFKSISFCRNEKLPQNLKADFDVSYKYSKKTSITVELIANINSESGLKIEIVLVGEYELINCSEMSQDEKKEILEKNTVAIMFPYLRSEISIITAQPFMPSITLPPININAFLDSKKI